MEKTCAYGFGKTVKEDFPEAASRVRAALQEQGFGILSEIDVQAKIQEKLGEDFRPYLILGACNPRLARKALEREVDLGLLLPCNVIVYVDDEKRTTVMAMDPEKALSVVGNPAMVEVAGEVGGLLRKALEGI